MQIGRERWRGIVPVFGGDFKTGFIAYVSSFTYGLFLTPNNNTCKEHCDSTSHVKSLGGCMDVELVTYPDTELNGVSGDNMLVAALIHRNLRKSERGSDRK